jgi:uridine kinase
VKVTIDQQEYTVHENQRWNELFPDKRYLGVSVAGRTLSLRSKIEPGVNAHLLTYQDEEGRRIYERTIQLVLLAAVKNVLPGRKVRIEHSLGEALFIELPGTTVTWGLVRRIEEQMRQFVAQDLPIPMTSCTKAEAIAYYRETDQQDKIRLFKYRKLDSFRFYELNGLKEYFYGEMAPSTGYVNVFKLRLYLPGLLLCTPHIHDPSTVAPFTDYPKLMKAFSETNKWVAMQRCENAADINEMIEQGRFNEFISVCESYQERSIGVIADEFVNSTARLICIAGPSSSGKTTFANRLTIVLKSLGYRPVRLSLDDYYLDQDTLPLEADGKPDLETIDALDLERLDADLVDLLQGEAVDTPVFDFTTHKRAAQGRRLQVPRDEPIIIEGIHGLNEKICPSVPREMKYKVYVSDLSMLNLDDHNRIRTTDARLLRRIVRDNLFRNTPPEDTMAMWDKVRRGEMKYIFPYQENADIVFNSSLAYELPILKHYSYDLLTAVPNTSPCYTLARRLVKFLNYIHPYDDVSFIPCDSLIREFIGGCCFYSSRDDD